MKLNENELNVPPDYLIQQNNTPSRKSQEAFKSFHENNIKLLDAAQFSNLSSIDNYDKF